VTFSSDEEDDADSDFTEDKNNENDEDDEKGSESSRSAKWWGLSADFRSGTGRKCLDKRSLQRFEVSHSPTSSSKECDRPSAVTPWKSLQAAHVPGM